MEALTLLLLDNSRDRQPLTIPMARLDEVIAAIALEGSTIREKVF
jgi:hypothetical protein